MIWKVAIIAGVAMLFQDLLSTSMVVMEASYRPLEASIFDSLNWFATLASTGVAAVTIGKHGWRAKQSMAIIGCVTAANFAGTYSGVYLAAALTHHRG